MEQEELLVQLQIRLAVVEEKLTRLEWIVYGSVWFIIVELIAIVTIFIKRP